MPARRVSAPCSNLNMAHHLVPHLFAAVCARLDILLVAACISVHTMPLCLLLHACMGLLALMQSLSNGLGPC